jgi:hypothetical protein
MVSLLVSVRYPTMLLPNSALMHQVSYQSRMIVSDSLTLYSQFQWRKKMMIQILQDLYPLDLTPKNHFEPIVKDDCWIDVKALLDRVPLIWSER